MSWYEERKLAYLERCGIEPHEEWPLFGVRKVLSEAGPVWVKLDHLPALDGHRDGLRRLLGEMRRLEYQLEAEGIVGWIQAIRIGNRKMRRWTELIGATLYATTEEHWYFKKEAHYATLPQTIHALVGRYGGQHHGSA